MAKSRKAGREIYIGIFVVTLATLTNQILITRIFSVTLFYHFAFAVISLTMLGLTLGSLIVFLYSKRFPYKTNNENLYFFTSLFAIFNLIAIYTHLNTAFLSSQTIESLMANLLLFLPGFTCSGVVVAMILSKYPKQVSSLYSADLCGAAVGCILTVLLLNFIDVINLILVISLFTGLAACYFVKGTKNKKLLFKSRLVLAGLVLALVANIISGYYGNHLRVLYAKGYPMQKPVYETWNSYSRVAVMPPIYGKLYGWGLSNKAISASNNDQFMMVDIDAGAATAMTSFSGDTSKLDFLKYDIINSAYHIRPVKNVAVIGVGGGRDILSALVFGVDKVTGIELNKDILNIINGEFGNFTGKLYENPHVKFVNDEARSYITRNDDLYDLIQVSLIDTWAATAAGAFALSENTLYTKEAWEGFMEKLSPDGLLSFSRWYNPYHHSGELYRMISLAVDALKTVGITDTRKHILAIYTKSIPSQVATLVVSRSPFTEAELSHLQTAVDEMDFQIMLSPYYAFNNQLKLLASDSPKKEEFIKRFYLDISSSTDNRPFFFNMTRLKDAYEQTDGDPNNKGMTVLVSVLIAVTAMSIIFIFGPLYFSSRIKVDKSSLLYVLFFAGIGLGFMFIEISQMQRLMIFLGHPTYALAVVLFSLLLSSGLGSLSTDKIKNLKEAKKRVLWLLLIVILFGIITDPIIEQFRSYHTLLRIIVAIIIVFPIGFFLGMAFPIGIKMVGSDRKTDMVPWLWGINGVTSVCASVLAVTVSMEYGISNSYWFGAFCYGIVASVFAKKVLFAK